MVRGSGLGDLFGLDSVGWMVVDGLLTLGTGQLGLVVDTPRVGCG